MQLTWNQVASTAAAPVSGYRIYQGGVQVWAGATTTTTITGLTNGTSYSFTVAASGTTRESTQSTPVVARPIAIPATPTGLAATPGNTQATLTWNPVTSTAAVPVTGYRLYRGTIKVYDGSATTVTDTGLTNGTSYNWTVTTTGPAGTSPASAPVAATPITMPTSPTGLAAIPGNTQVQLSWNPVASTATAPVTGYRIYQGFSCVWSGTTTSTTVSGLTNGTDYGFTVTAYGSGGESSRSAPVTARPVAAPAAPASISAAAGDGLASITWPAVASTAAAPVTGYRIYRGGVALTTVAGQSYLDAPLTNGIDYSYVVTAYGPGGESLRTGPTSVRPITAPAAPQNIVGTVGAGQVTVSWDPVPNTAAAPLTGYQVWRDGIKVYDGPATSFTNTGLTDGTSYTFAVVAYGPGGSSAGAVNPMALPSARTLTPAHAPAIPTGLGAASGDTQVTLSWNPVVSTAAAPLSGYRIYRGGNLIWSGGSTSVTVSGLINGATYSYTVTAYGPGGESAGASVSQTPYGPPPAPASVTATAGNTTVAVSWTAVASTAGAPLTGYQVYRNGNQIYSGTGLTVTDTGLTNGVTYNYEVRAYNAHGYNAATATAVPITAPATPAGLAAAPSNAQVQLTWTAVGNTAAAPVSGYRVYQDGVQVWSGATTTTTITGLTNGTTYSFTVAAYGSGGASAQSAPVSATPKTVPSAVLAAGEVPTRVQMFMGGAKYIDWSEGAFAMGITTQQVRVGWSGSTGASNDYHEIRNVSINNIASPTLTFNGSAFQASTYQVLTTNGNNQVGTIWTNQIGAAGNLDVQWDQYMGGGTGADGMTVMVAPVTTSVHAIGNDPAHGEMLGASDIVQGYGFYGVYDTYQNPANSLGPADPSNNYMCAAPSASYSTGASRFNCLQTNTAIPSLRGGWTHMELKMTQPKNAVGLRFNAPSNNGGSAITNCRVTASPGGATVTTPCSDGASDIPVYVTGLAAGTTYTFSIQAQNSAGWGPATTVTAKTPSP